MKAFVITEFGGPDVLHLADVPTPEPTAGEVRIRVQAIAVARTKDVATRAGRPPFAHLVKNFPHVLGTEHAGVVDAVGPGVDDALIGSRVAVSAVLSCGSCPACRQGREEACEHFALLGIDRPGSYAEYTVVPATNVHILPSDVTAVDAAAVAANGPVARAQLDAGLVGAGSTVLVIGAGGSLGSTAATLAAWRGAQVIGIDQLSRHPGCLDGLPIVAALDGNAEDLADQVRAAAGDHGLDCVIDNLGISSLWEAYRPALADMGRIIVSGAISHEPLPMRLLPFYLHNQSLIGVRTGNRHQMAAMWEDVRKGFRPPATHVHPMGWLDAAIAHGLVEAGTARGQSILEISLLGVRASHPCSPALASERLPLCVNYLGARLSFPEQAAGSAARSRTSLLALACQSVYGTSTR